MRWNLLMVVLAISPGAIAQQDVTRLQCDGSFSQYSRNLQDVPLSGGYVEVLSNGVRVAGILNFGSGNSSYRISHSDESGICFVHPSDNRTWGCLNRLNGELQLTTRAQEDKLSPVTLIYTGKCRPVRPLF